MPLQGSAAVYATAISIGMMHGVEPGHGWPVAAVFALRQRHRWWYGIWAAMILGIAHLASSFVVVAVYAAANHVWKLDSLEWMNYVAGGLLLLMAVHQWRTGGHHHHHHHGHHHHRHPHAHGDHGDHGDHADHGAHADHDTHADHEHGEPDAPLGLEALPADTRAPRSFKNLLGLVGFAFALGFVHEEEFAIIALAVGKANAWAVMGVYAAAVAASLVILTALAIATLNRFQDRLHRYEHQLPRVSAAVLGLMGLAYLFRLL